MPLRVKPIASATPAATLPTSRKPSDQRDLLGHLRIPGKKVKSREGKRRKRSNRIDAESLFNQPWLISESALQALVAEYLVSRSASFDDDEDEDDDDDGSPYLLTPEGIACIPIMGPLSRRSYWRMTYGEIADMCAHAMANSAAKSILLCCDSPGGEVSGMFDLANQIYGMRGAKPIAAISDDSCYSACYAIATAADKIFVTQTGGVGSVGCWMAHVDISELLKNEGVKVTLVSSGAKKTDGNQFEPLSKRARADMQEESDRIRAMFVQLVARNRSISADAVFDTEAGIFMAEKGIPLLADNLGTMDDALTYLRGRISEEDEFDADDPKAPEEDLSNPLAANVPFSYTSPDGKFTITGFSTGATTGQSNTFTIHPLSENHEPEESILAARAGIKKLNGARTAAAMSSTERERQYAELSAQIKAGGKEPEPLKSEAEIAAVLVPFDTWKDPAEITACINKHSHLNSSKPVGWAQYEYSEAESEQLFGQPGAILAVRLFSEARSCTPSDGRKISILAVPYNDLCTIGGIHERYEKNCFSNGLNGDPRVLFDHQEQYVLGRKSAGTARFYEDSDGVHAEADAPDTQWATDMLTSMRRGDITGASASFWILQSRWEMRGTDRVRVIEKALMREASVHAFPAYEQSSATVSTQTSVSESELALQASTHIVNELLGAKLRLLTLS
jgi:HK97 family phage prohead protease